MDMISLLIALIFVLIVFVLLWWVISFIPFPPGFPVWVIHVILALVLVLILISYMAPLIRAPALLR